MNQLTNNQINKSTATDQQSDEIDLKQLFFTLWKGKWLIVFITFIGTAIALAYALLAQPWWSSAAIVQQPKDYQLYGYTKEIADYANVVEYKPWHNDEIFKRFISEFNSFDNKKSFLEQSDDIAEIKKDLNLKFENATSELMFYSDWSAKIEAVLVDEKKPEKGIKLSFQSTTQENSLNLLTKYVDYINNITNNDIFKDFQTVVNLQLDTLQSRKSYLEPIIKENLQINLFKVDEAYKIAKAAEIEKPLENFNDSDTFAINLGSDALKAKSEILHQLEQNLDKNLKVFSSEWKDLEYKLNFLMQKKEITLSKVTTYQYISSPEMPISRDKPKRSLIVIIGFLLGGIIGCGIVLVRSAFRNEQKV